MEHSSVSQIRSLGANCRSRPFANKTSFGNLPPGTLPKHLTACCADFAFSQQNQAPASHFTKDLRAFGVSGIIAGLDVPSFQ
jgi:hypothetical protein